MNKLLIAVTMLSLTGIAYANCGNDNGNGNGCSGDQILSFSGISDALAVNGTNGTDGVNGKDGKDGVKGQDADTHATMVLDTAVRLYDGKRIQVQAFNVYRFSRTQGDNVIERGQNFSFGARVIFKLGSSYEERLLASQDEKIKRLEASLSRVQ